MSHSFGTLDIRQLNEDDSDGEDDFEGEKERQEELQRQLSEAFEDMSSIDDAEDDEDDEHSTEHARRAPVLNSPSGLSPARIISTPRLISSASDKMRFNNLSIIEDEGSISEENNDKINESHVRLLLNDNERLSAENDKLKRQLSIANGDYDGLSFKYRQLEEQLNNKDKDIQELRGKLNAEKMASQEYLEAHRESQGKAAIYEETITALRSQLADMTRSDCVERLRQSYEVQIKRLKENIESNRITWIEEKDQLQEQIEDYKHKISRLRLELTTKQAANTQLKTLKSPDEKKLPSESFQQLKLELDNVMDSNQSLRQQISNLKSSLQDAKNEVNFLKNDSNAKQAEINSLTDELKDLKEMVDNKNREIKQQEQEIQQRAQQLNLASDTIDAMKKRIETLIEENSKLEKEVNQRGQDFVPKSQLSQLAASATEKWRKEIEQTYQEEVATKVKQQLTQEKKSWQARLEADVNLLVIWLKNMMSCDGIRPSQPEVSKVFEPLTRLWKLIDEQFDQQLETLRDRKKQVENAIKELEEAYHMSRIDETGDRLEKRGFELEDQDEEDQVRHEQVILLDQARQQLEEAKQEASKFRYKLEKYKKHCLELRAQAQREQEQLKTEFSSILRKRLMYMREREESLRNRITQDSQQLIKQINQAYVLSLRMLKEQTENYLERSNTKSLDKMAIAIVRYHELVMSKIDQRAKRLQNHLEVHHNTSVHEVEDDVSIIQGIPSLSLH